MTHTMTYGEVKLAMRIIGLRGTSRFAKKNYWKYRFKKDLKNIEDLDMKGLIKPVLLNGTWGWELTPKGIQQLKQQIGEFTFKIN